VEQTYDPWWNEYSGLKVDQARRVGEREAEASGVGVEPREVVRKDIAQGNFCVLSDGTVRSAMRAQRMRSAHGMRGK
jgi:hypothetical protein